MLAEEAVRRMLKDDALAGVLKQRVMYIEDRYWDAMGLPRAPAEESEVG